LQRWKDKAVECFDQLPQHLSSAYRRREQKADSMLLVLHASRNGARALSLLIPIFKLATTASYQMRRQKTVFAWWLLLMTSETQLAHKRL
jgi:hypothetical protein